jgi:predicted porin
MKLLCVSICALVASSVAYAADLPTKKGAPASPEKPSCFSDLLHYFDSSPADCPLTAYGFTFYAIVDMGVGYETHATPFNGEFLTGVDELLHKTNRGPAWLATPNGLSQSQVGVKIKEPLAYGWSVVAEVGTGFDPYSLQLANGPGSMVQNNTRTLANQNTNDDSSRAGQWDNSVAYGGFSHPVFGTLTAGRVNSLTLDVVNAYDPMGGSYAFSPIGWSGKVPGAGGTEDARMGTGVKYLVNVSNFRASAMVQLGGYDLNNGSTSDVQVGLGGDFNTLSLDGVYTHIENQVNLSSYNGSIPAGVPIDALKATLSNNDAVMLAAKYKWNQFTFFDGGEWVRYSNPSNTSGDGFTNIGGYPVVSNSVYAKSITINNYNKPLDFYALWTGAKYAINDRLDLTGAYYLYIQNDFRDNRATESCAANTTVAAAGYAPLGTSSSKCRGYENMFSAMLDYRPLKRVDIYGGFFYQRVSGGIATGYLEPDNFAPTVGIRIKF